MYSTHVAQLVNAIYTQVQATFVPAGLANILKISHTKLFI